MSGRTGLKNSVFLSGRVTEFILRKSIGKSFFFFRLPTRATKSVKLKKRKGIGMNTGQGNKKRASKPYKQSLHARLRKPAYASLYLQEVLKFGDKAVFQSAVRDVTEARCVTLRRRGAVC